VSGDPGGAGRAVVLADPETLPQAAANWRALVPDVPPPQEWNFDLDRPPDAASNNLWRGTEGPTLIGERRHNQMNADGDAFSAWVDKTAHVFKISDQLANRQASQGVEQLRAVFFKMNGQVLRKAIDHLDIELAFYDLNCSQHPVQEAREIALSVHRTPAPLSGGLFKFLLLQTRVDEFYSLDESEHARLDGWGNPMLLA
jgi:hypothetical protein